MVRLLIGLLLATLCNPPAMLAGEVMRGSGGAAGIILDTPSYFTDGYTSATEAFNHTVGSGTNRLLMVSVATRGAEAVSAITYGGVSMTRADGITPGNMHTALWYLLDPASGTASVSMTCTTTLIITAQAVSLSGVNQSTPFGTLVKASGTSAAATVNASSGVGEVVIDFVSTRGGEALTEGAGQTSIIETINSTYISSGVSTEPGAATTTMSWTWATGVAWSQIAIPVKPI